MKSKRNLHQIVVEALECYSYQANVESESFKRVVADKVYEDFCKEFYPPESTTADEHNKVYISDVNKEIVDEMNKAIKETPEYKLGKSLVGRYNEMDF